MTLNPKNNGSVYETLSIYDTYFSVSLEQLSRRGESSHHLRRRYSAWQRGLYSYNHGFVTSYQKTFYHMIMRSEEMLKFLAFVLRKWTVSYDSLCLVLCIACFTHWDTRDAMTETLLCVFAGGRSLRRFTSWTWRTGAWSLTPPLPVGRSVNRSQIYINRGVNHLEWRRGV